MTVEAITIVCRDSTHESKESIVTRFVRLPATDANWWQEDVGRSARLKREGKPIKLSAFGGVTLPPKADKPEAFQSIDAHGRPSLGASVMGGHNKYRFRCELCGVTVPVREDKLVPVLDGLAENGLRVLTLADLAAIIR